MTSAYLAKVLKFYFQDKPVSKVMLFGSYARNEQKRNSDVDIIIRPEKPLGLFVISGYKNDLQEILKKNIDIATEKGISAFILPSIQADLLTIYEK